MKWDQYVGTIEVGKAADLVVLDNINTNPYRNMINAIDTDVRLTVIGGIPIYGDQDLMSAMKGDDWEDAGLGKALDVTFIGVEDGGQSWEDIVGDLEMAMRFDYNEMNEAFGDSLSDFDSQVSNMVNVGLDPVHTWGDERYFRVINSSNSANSQIDMSLLYDRYYDRTASIDTVEGEEINYIDSNPVTYVYGCTISTALNTILTQHETMEVVHLSKLQTTRTRNKPTALVMVMEILVLEYVKIQTSQIVHKPKQMKI